MKAPKLSRSTKRLVAAGAAVAGLASVGGLVLYAGLYDISATDQHLAPTYWLLDVGMRRSVERRAAGIDVPQLGGQAQLARGLALFRAHCVACHGAPGVAPEPFATGMTPVPTSLVHAAKAFEPAALYWIVSQGIKMTGMPAWEFRLTDEDIWSLVAFMERLPALSPTDYQAMQAPAPPAHEPAVAAGPPDPERGRRAIEQHACVTCHRIPGIVGPNSPVGPPLDRIGTRGVLAGLLPNTPENMARWLMEPQRVHPGSAMPDLGVDARDARDMAAYLGTLK